MGRVVRRGRGHLQRCGVVRRYEDRPDKRGSHGLRVLWHVPQPISQGMGAPAPPGVRAERRHQSTVGFAPDQRRPGEVARPSSCRNPISTRRPRRAPCCSPRPPTPPGRSACTPYSAAVVLADLGVLGVQLFAGWTPVSSWCQRDVTRVSSSPSADTTDAFAPVISRAWTRLSLIRGNPNRMHGVREHRGPTPRHAFSTAFAD